LSIHYEAPQYKVSPLPCYLVPLRPKCSPQHAFRCLGRTKMSAHVRGFVCEHLVTKIRFHGEELLVPCLLNIFAATLHIGGRSYIRNIQILRIANPILLPNYCVPSVASSLAPGDINATWQLFNSSCRNIYCKMSSGLTEWNYQATETASCL
jgi:hypothetical protein